MPTVSVRSVGLALLMGTLLGMPAAAFQQPREKTSASDLKRRLNDQADKPVDAHKALAAFVGEFDQKVEMNAGPNGKLDVKAVEKGRWILGERYVQVESASAEGEELHGERTVIYGYDPVAKVYTLYSIDSSSLAATTATGTFDDATKTFTFEGEVLAGPVKFPFKWILKILKGGVIDHKILVKFQGDEFTEVASVVHTPKGK